MLAAGADEQRVIDLCVSPDGSSVVAAGRDHNVHRWRFVSDALVPDPTALIGHASTIRDVQCLSSSRFVSLGGDGLVVWDLNRPARTGRTLDLTGHGLSSVQAVAVRPGVTHDVAVAAVDEPTGTGGVVVSTPLGADRLLDLGGVFPLALSYSPNGAYLAVAGDTSARAGWVGLYDAERLTPIFAGAAAELATLRAVAVVDAEHWAVGSDAGKFEVHDGDAVGHNTVESGFGVTSLAYAPDGRLIVGDSTGFLSCYDPTDLGRVLGQRALGRAIPSIAVGENGVVAVGTHDGVVAIYPHAFGAGGATNGSDCDPSVWTQTGIAVESDAAHSVALAARGQLLAAGTNDGTVELLDVKRTRRIGTLTIDWDGAPASVGMDSDATTIAVGAGNHVEVYALDRDLLRSYLCKLAGRDLTEDERAVFLPEGNQQETARC